MYELIARWVTRTPWAILPEKLDAILGVLSIRADGGQISPEEIAAVTNGRKPAAPVRAGEDAMIAVLPLYGVIAHRADMLVESSGGTSTLRFSQALRGLLSDNTVSAIVLDVDSPGGAADGIPELAAEIYRARESKPIVAVANTLAASAAYWIATAATEMWVSPSGEVGSIGVWAAHQDLSAFYEDAGIRTTLISAGKYKTETSPYGPLNEEARAYLQERVDEVYGAFVADVARQRGQSRETVRSGFGEGRLVGARQGLALGMVDAIGTLDEAIARAATLARRVDREKARAGAQDEAIRLRLAGL